MELWIAMALGIGAAIIYAVMKTRSKPHIDLAGFKIDATHMSQALEDAIENGVKLRFEMRKAGYEYVGGEFDPHRRGEEYTGWCMYVRRMDNHVRRFVLEHGIWTEQVVEGTLSELEQIP